MSSSATPLSATGVRDAGTIRFVHAALLVLFTYVFLANAWTGDDAQITFRTAWNFVHGYGLTYNPDERVQAYTHPLWVFMIAAAHALTGGFYLTVTALSWLFNVAAGVLLIRPVPQLGQRVLLVLWIVSSKALIDYTSSGLEYPLSYFLLAWFYTRYLARAAGTAPSPEELRFFVLLAALAFVNRVDSAILYALPILEMTARSARSNFRQTVRALAVGASPVVLWLLFATFYYGFPLPNTYYAKVANGIPSWLLRQQGWAYLLNSIRYDPITIGTITLTALMALGTPGPVRRAALSAVMYVVYTVWVGGDFMSGRFFAMPFLLSIIALVPMIDASITIWTAAALVLYNVLVPIAPIKTTASYDGAWPWRTQNGIKDERGHSHQASNPLFFSPFHALPNTVFGREGLSFGAGDRKATVYPSIGHFGMNAGPTKHIVDDNALSDPLLARLPVSPRVYFDFWASHYFRDLPEGYLESNERNENLLRDPLLREYYDRLRNVTRGSLFRGSRFADIWALNVGYRRLHEDYEKQRPLALSIPANHMRFHTDVGFRDDPAGVMRTTGRGGYLQYGPGIPLRARFYRARWIGVVDEAPGGQVGFVEIWNGDMRLDRQPVLARGAGEAKDRRIAQLDFTLSDDARAVEYRFYVHAGVRMTLERVELFSGVSIPGEESSHRKFLLKNSLPT